MHRKVLKKALPVLNVLKSLRSDKLVVLLPHLDDTIQSVLCECIRNCLHNKKISQRKRQQLKKKLATHKHICRYLSGCTSIKKQKKLLPQVGGGLGLILGAALPLLANFLFPKSK
jgi:hypothetical protein